MGVGPGYCSRCGVRTEGANISLCPRCKSMMDREVKQRKEQEEKRKNQQKTYTLTANADGSVTKTYEDGSSYTESSKSITTKCTVIILLIILIAAGAFLFLRHRKYTSNENLLYNRFEITETLSGNAEEFADLCMSGYNSCKSYRILVTDRGKSGFSKNIFDFSKKGRADIRFWEEDGHDVYSFDFSGYDFGTGLDGEYYITEVNGVPSVVSLQSKTIYPEGSEFYNKYYEKLSALGYASLIHRTSASLSGAEYGKSSGYGNTILKNNKTSACVYSENGNVDILDESGDKRLLYAVEFHSENQYKTDSLSTFKTYGDQGAEPESRLGKLLAEKDDFANIHIYEDESEVADIRYSLSDGYPSFRFDNMGYKGFLEDYTYILKEEDGKIALRRYNPDTSKSEITEYDISEMQEQYDFLKALIPADYVLANFDLDSAKKSGFFDIFAKYTLSDENGDKKAKLYIVFGKLNGVDFYTSDTERITISW